MGVFYNSSVSINSLSVTNLTVSNLVATNAQISATIQSAQTGAVSLFRHAAESVLASQLVFVTSPTVTFGISTAVGSVATITASTSGASAPLIQAGTTSNSLSSVIFSNTTGFSFGLATGANAGTITASTDYKWRPYHNYPQMMRATAVTFGNWYGSSNFVQPLNLLYPLAFKMVRIPVSLSYQTAGQSITDGTGAFSEFHTFNFNIYTLGVGASSSVLQLSTGLTAGKTYALTFSIATANSSQSVGQTFTFGQNDILSSWSTSYNTNQGTSIGILTQSISGFTGSRFIDMVFTNATGASFAPISLAPGNYWVAFAMSRATSTAGNAFTRASYSFNNYVFTQYASGFSPMNVVSTYLKLGYGRWSATTSGGTSASLALSNILTNASNIEFSYEMISFT